HQGEDVYQRDLEKRFEIRRSTATQMLSLMEKNGLILRQPVSHDARLKRLVLTPKAVALHKNVEKEIKGIEESLMQGVSVEEMEIFFAVIDKVKANLTAKE
ncbi:MAG: MarR family transcriptional regulator, partial [Clostridia bacterium]|nr:MarR family transcriptional regulator [Clostridia bacterium]